jgi:hypothetical protein
MRTARVIQTSAFVLREARRSSVGSAKCTATRLRCLLRFLHVEGAISHDLTGAVPRVASWRLASLVKALAATASGDCSEAAIRAAAPAGVTSRC